MPALPTSSLPVRTRQSALPRACPVGPEKQPESGTRSRIPRSASGRPAPRPVSAPRPAPLAAVAPPVAATPRPIPLAAVAPPVAAPPARVSSRRPPVPAPSSRPLWIPPSGKSIPTFANLPPPAKKTRSRPGPALKSCLRVRLAPVPSPEPVVAAPPPSSSAPAPLAVPSSCPKEILDLLLEAGVPVTLSPSASRSPSPAPSSSFCSSPPRSPSPVLSSPEPRSPGRFGGLKPPSVFYKPEPESEVVDEETDGFTLASLRLSVLRGDYEDKSLPERLERERAKRIAKARDIKAEDVDESLSRRLARKFGTRYDVPATRHVVVAAPKSRGVQWDPVVRSRQFDLREPATRAGPALRPPPRTRT